MGRRFRQQVYLYSGSSHWLRLFTQTGYTQTGYLPPCYEAKQVNVALDSAERHIPVDFIRSCERHKWPGDKGIVQLNEPHNNQGRLCWRLESGIDDGYKDTPPNRFANFDGDIILIFEADSKGIRLKQCLEQIIGDRVYTRPAIRSRWTSPVLPLSNHKLKGGRRRAHAGNGSELLIILSADGRYEALLPVYYPG